jgi:hypothetical protein
MSLRRSTFFALTLALSAIGCRRPYDHDVPGTKQKGVERASESTVTSPEVVTPSESGASNAAPGSALSLAPQVVTPQAVAPQVVEVVTPQTIAPQAALPATPPFAPQVRPSTNDAGVIVPVVPLYIDPGATPGTPGNGAPDTSTNGQP